MNKIVFIIIAAGLFIGCSKKNNPLPVTPAPVTLTGKWHYSKDTVTYYNNNVQTKQSAFTYSIMDYLEFNSDGSGQQGLVDASNNFYTVTFTYKQGLDSALVFSYPAQTADGIAQVAYTLTSTLKTLTANSLVLDFDTFESVNNNSMTIIEVTHFSK